MPNEYKYVTYSALRSVNTNVSLTQLAKQTGLLNDPLAEDILTRIFYVLTVQTYVCTAQLWYPCFPGDQ